MGMRIAMIGWELPPYASGGLGVHCSELTRALAGLGVQIDFFMPRTSGGVSCDWMTLVQVEGARIPSRFLPYMDFREEYVAPGDLLEENYGQNFFESVDKYTRLAALLVAERHAVKPYSLVHCHDWMTVRAGIEVKRLTGLPLCFTVHSTEFDRTADLWPMQWIADVEREGMHAADVVVTVSERMRQQLVQRFGVPNEKIRVVPNAVDARKFTAPRAAKKKRFWWKKIVLYHGRLSVQKGPDYFLRAAKRVAESHPDTLFVVSGKGGMLPTLVDLAIDLGIQNRVLFLGYLPEAKLPAVYAASDVYVLPSVSEPFGITALEAMASGKPVIVSKSSGVGEFVKNVFRADFWDVDKMAAQISEILVDEELRDSLGKGAKAEAQSFSWRSVAEKTLGVYDSVAGAKNSVAQSANAGVGENVVVGSGV